ncbi:MAG: bifunctional adenosylcobinamide kinase/adenosylcobinamide-phosphate guanylyltransferase [Candidatus Choladocola sp.]|nr:bifunctional adenosylcobinamide kinase/adenosylcobinamide-phosphate guanylyltransferase [Candidatus Choladocola sp.]
MKLIIGGAYQGKLEYAKKTYGTEAGWIDGAMCGFDEIRTCSGIYHFHKYIKRLLTETGNLCPDERTESWNKYPSDDLAGLEVQAEQFAEKLRKENPDIIIVSTELGYGVVPVEKSDRTYREATGRVCTCLAAKAEEVVRVVCGIGMKLK